MISLLSSDIPGMLSFSGFPAVLGRHIENSREIEARYSLLGNAQEFSYVGDLLQFRRIKK